VVMEREHAGADICCRCNWSSYKLLVRGVPEGGSFCRRQLKRLGRQNALIVNPFGCESSETQSTEIVPRSASRPAGYGGGAAQPESGLAHGGLGMVAHVELRRWVKKNGENRPFRSVFCCET